MFTRWQILLRGRVGKTEYMYLYLQRGTFAFQMLHGRWEMLQLIRYVPSCYCRPYCVDRTWLVSKRQSSPLEVLTWKIVDKRFRGLKSISGEPSPPKARALAGLMAECRRITFFIRFVRSFTLLPPPDRHCLDQMDEKGKTWLLAWSDCQSFATNPTNKLPDRVNIRLLIKAVVQHLLDNCTLESAQRKTAKIWFDLVARKWLGVFVNTRFEQRNCNCCMSIQPSSCNKKRVWTAANIYMSRSWPSLWGQGVALGTIRGGHKTAPSAPIDFCRFAKYPPYPSYELWPTPMYLQSSLTLLFFSILITPLSSSRASPQYHHHHHHCHHHHHHIPLCLLWFITNSICECSRVNVETELWSVVLSPKLPALCVWARAKIVRNTRQKKWQILDRNTDRCQASIAVLHARAQWRKCKFLLVGREGECTVSTVSY